MNLPPGWLSDEEAEVLASLATNGLVMEFGSYTGRSTVAMAQTARLVVSIDHHRGSAEHRAGLTPTNLAPHRILSKGAIDTLPEFRHQLRLHKVEDRVIVVEGPVEVAAPLFRPFTWDLVFIDAAHDQESVMAHGRLGALLIRPGGQVVFHDAGHEGVARALNLLTADGPPWEPLGGSLARLPMAAAGIRAVPRSR